MSLVIRGHSYLELVGLVGNLVGKQCPEELGRKVLEPILISSRQKFKPFYYRVIL